MVEQPGEAGARRDAGAVGSVVGQVEGLPGDGFALEPEERDERPASALAGERDGAPVRVAQRDRLRAVGRRDCAAGEFR